MSLKIMIVDNELITLKLMRSIIAPLGHQILTLQESREAAERAETQRFDVVFVDIRMAHLDRLELTRRIQNSQVNRETAIVMMSATDETETLRNAFSEGATLVLTKPISPSQLIPMLTAMERPGWKDQRHAARLPLFAQVSCKWDDKQFALRSLNISETGMLLESSADLEEGQEVSLQFKIGEVRASLNVRARIARKDSRGCVGVEFNDLAPEDRNAIQLYILGRLRTQAPPRKPLQTKPSRLRLFRPNE
jgi:CheY-like chemotaxis protein